MPRLGSGIPLVGRVDELRRLRGAFGRADQGAAAAVLLSGDAGVGKTRLLAELADHAASRDALVLPGRCLDMQEGGLPYLAFAEALAPLTDSREPSVADAVRRRPALARLLPQLAVVPPATEHAQAPQTDAEQLYRARPVQDLGELQLFDAVLGVLTEVSEQRPVLLVVEDLHWADGSTRHLLSFLLSRLRAQRLMVVGSYREEDVYRRHPLRRLLSELVRLPAVERIDLAPFATAEARTFVEAMAEEPLSADVVADVVERSEGNPFFLEELLASCTRCDDLPAGLAEVLLARLERLAPDTRRVLRAIAVAGDSVAHAALAKVSGLGESELDDALREAVQHHVLVIEKGYYEFRHALLQEAVYGDVLPGERTRMHAAYAERVRSKAQGRGHDAKLAYHSLRSKDLPTALAALVRAADEAERLGAPGTALQHMEQALEIWDAVGQEDRPPDVDELMLLHEATYFAATSGEPERAIAFARSAVEALGPEMAAERAAAAWRVLAEALMALDATFEEAVGTIGKAWELVEHSPPSKERAKVLATRAQVERGIGNMEVARWSAETAVADARAVGARGAEANALITLGAHADSAGDPGEARKRLIEAEQKARDAGALNVELRALYFRALSHDDQAEIAAALEVYGRGIARAEEVGLSWSSFGLGVRARQASLRYINGDWPADPDAEWPTAAVSGTVLAMLATARVHLAVARGRFIEAEQLVAKLRAHRRADVLIARDASTAGVELARWQGEHALAAQRAQEGIGWLESIFPWALAGVRVGALGLEACVDWAAEARLRGDAAVEAEARSAADALIAHVRGCVEHGKPRAGTLGPEGHAWLARAEAAASGVDGAADPALWAKAVSAFGYGAVYEQAVSRLHHAEALLAAGDGELAAEQLRAAHELARRLDARSLDEAVRALAHRARTSLPGEAPRRDVTDPLTERERAVLERVAQGRTNRQVGEELYISEKTVSVHLSRVMAKLGAGRRAEAVAIAYDRGLLVR